VKKYILRLGVFAAVSELPFDLMLMPKNAENLKFVDWSHQNVFFTLTLALLGLYFFDFFLKTGDKAPALVVLFASALAAELSNADYGAYGVLIIFVFYMFRDKKPLLSAVFTGVVVLYSAAIYFEYLNSANLRNLFEIAALIPILFYNRKKGYASKTLQWGFYVFYPAHMLLLALL
jgi:hypothetical protein